MKIVLLPLSNDGCHWYRNFQPYEEIKKQGLADVMMVTDDDMKVRSDEVAKHMADADYIVGRFSHREYIKWLDKYLPGKKVVIDNDDYVFNPDPYGDIYGAYGVFEIKHNGEWLWKDGEGGFNIKANIERKKSDMELMARADILTVSTPRLKDLYQHPNCKVVYNALDLDTWKPYEIKKDSTFRIGWSGGSSHYSDIYTIKEDMEYICNKYPQVRLVLSGTPFSGIFKNINPKQIITQNWIDISGHAYRTILNNLDLAIIPLATNEFNKYKSCVKWYEYASIKVPCIAYDYPPYSDEMPKIALTNDFRKTISELMDSKAKRDKLTEDGYKWVTKNRDIKDIAKDLFNYLNES